MRKLCEGFSKKLATKHQLLLAFLVTQAGRSFSRDLLAGTFWPDRPDPRARRALSQALWQIRRTLSPALRQSFDRAQDRAQDTAADRLVTEGDTMTWVPRPHDWLDVAAFGEKVSKYTSRQVLVSSPTCLLELSEAVALYRGDFLEECYDDWALLERERLQELYLGALETLTAAHKQGYVFNSAATALYHSI